MFNIAEALLSERGLKFNKHSAVHAAFGEHFAKTEEMDVKFHRWLLDAFDKRLAGDYEVDTEIERGVAVNVIHQAREFLETAQAYLDKQQT
jgi:uncharacterized protein (UPF0332 family)